MDKYNIVETIEPSGNTDKDITNLVDTLFSKCNSFYDCVLCNLEPHKGEFVFAPAFHYRSDPTKNERYECRILYPNGKIKSGSFSKLLYEIYMGNLVDGRLYYIDGDPNNFYPKNMRYVPLDTFPADPPYPSNWKKKIRKVRFHEDGRIFRREIVRLTCGGILCKQIGLARYVYETQVLHDFLPSGVEIDHIDGDPLNNDPSNLRAISRLENKVKMFFNRENIYTFGKTIYEMKCPACGKIFAQNEVYVRSRQMGDPNKRIKCNINCPKTIDVDLNDKPFSDQFIRSYISYKAIDKDLRSIGPKGFVNALKVIPYDKPIPIFNTIFAYVDDAEWLDAFRIIYKDRLNNGLTSGEKPELIERLKCVLNQEA
jgi:hypothetical protein